MRQPSALGQYSPQRGDVSHHICSYRQKDLYSLQRGDVSDVSNDHALTGAYSPQRGDVSFPKIKFIVAPVSSTQ